MTRFSIIIPVLNEAASIASTLSSLQGFRPLCELIVVDGGSVDQTTAWASPLVDKLLSTRPGRAIQMNQGAQHARGEILIFLHADTFLPQQILYDIERALQTHNWGRCPIELRGQHAMLPVISLMMNIRSRLTWLATGDQVMFCKCSVFEHVGGFPEIELMEDIAISKRLKQHSGWPALAKSKVVSSGRRWDKFGAFNTILLMWSLRIRYALGQDPALLNRLYREGKLWK